MENQQLMPGEEILMQSGDKTITLTNFRIRQYEKQMGSSNLVSMHLEKLSAVEINYQSKILFILLAILSFAAGVFYAFYSNRTDTMGLGIIPGLIFVLAYWLTRKHVVSIASDSGVKINFHTKRMKKETLMSFINKLEEAKHDFILKNK